MTNETKDSYLPKKTFVDSPFSISSNSIVYTLLYNIFMFIVIPYLIIDSWYFINFTSYSTSLRNFYNSMQPLFPFVLGLLIILSLGRYLIANQDQQAVVGSNFLEFRKSRKKVMFYSRDIDLLKITMDSTCVILISTPMKLEELEFNKFKLSKIKLFVENIIYFIDDSLFEYNLVVTDTSLEFLVKRRTVPVDIYEKTSHWKDGLGRKAMNNAIKFGVSAFVLGYLMILVLLLSASNLNLYLGVSEFIVLLIELFLLVLTILTGIIAIRNLNYVKYKVNEFSPKKRKDPVPIEKVINIEIVENEGTVTLTGEYSLEGYYPIIEGKVSNIEVIPQAHFSKNIIIESRREIEGFFGYF